MILFLTARFLLFIIIYFLLCWSFLAACRLSLVAVSRGYSPVVVHGLLIAVVSFVASTGSWHVGSVPAAHRLSCFKAYGIVPDQGLNPWSLQWQAHSYPLYHQGSPRPAILDWSLESPEGLTKSQIAGPYSRVSNSVGLGWGPSVCISNKLPDADAADLEATL